MVTRTDLLGLCGVNVGVNQGGQLRLKQMRVALEQNWGGEQKQKECVVLFVEAKFVNNILGLQWAFKIKKRLPI